MRQDVILDARGPGRYADRHSPAEHRLIYQHESPPIDS